jgi:hypothetical protein
VPDLDGPYSSMTARFAVSLLLLITALILSAGP